VRSNERRSWVATSGTKLGRIRPCAIEQAAAALADGLAVNDFVRIDQEQLRLRRVSAG
jgi:hypothetical protein